MRFATTVFLACGLAAPLSARTQDPPPTSQDELDRRVEELLRENAEFNRRSEATSRTLEATLANLGGGPPWPPADPEFTTPESWREALLAAPRFGLAQVLAEVATVRLELGMTVQVPKVCPRYEACLEIVEAVHASGRRTDRDAGAILRVDLQLVMTDFDLTRFGVGRVPFHFFRCNAALVLPARVLRGEEPRHTRITVGSVEELWIAPGELGRESLVGAIDRTLARLFAGASDTRSPEPANNAWAAWLGEPALAATRGTAFRDSRRVDEALDSGLAAITAFGAVEGAVQARVRTPDVDAVAAVSPADEWIATLGAHGLALDALDGPRLAHDVRIESTEQIPGASSAHVGRSRVSVTELDALATLGGRFVRVGGRSYDDLEFFIGLPGAMETFARDSATKVRQRGLEALGRAGLPPLPPHPDAEAVDAFLATRQRIEVPAAERRAIANRIAHALANAPGVPESMKREWILELDGKRMYWLPYVGGARQGSSSPRSVREAVDRAIEDLERADPIGFYAFDQPWNHDGDRRVVLPDDFAEYFVRPRPSGPGALCSVRVVDAFEYAWQQLGVLDFDERTPLRVELDTVRNQIAKSRVLLCQYISADGNMNLVHPRAFWYVSAPSDWPQIVARLSPASPLRSIGSARRRAPDYLAEAENPGR